MSDIKCITSFLDTPRFAVSLLTIISSTQFTCISNRNFLFLIGKPFSYLIAFLTALLKQSTTIIWGTAYSPKPKYPPSHNVSNFGYQCLSSDFFSLGQFSSVYHELIFNFSGGSSLSWSSLSLVTVDVSCSSELSAPYSKGINYHNPTTNFVSNVTRIFFLR